MLALLIKKNIFVENIFNLIVHQHQNENVPAKQITDFFLES